MQDCYVGDIGDYGKYGLLREVSKAGLSLSVNWYKVNPVKRGKQDDGKYISYLYDSALYRVYDSALFDSLQKIVINEHSRKIERIEEENLFSAVYFSEELSQPRENWHSRALDRTKNSKIVFLDPDNGLETAGMHKSDRATEKHVKWSELRDYYMRGQSVILYQHRPQMMTKEKCIENVLDFQNSFLYADCIKLLEFPKYTNRFYFVFLHESDKDAFNRIFDSMTLKWSKNNFCREIIL